MAGQGAAGFEFTLKASQAITHPASSPTYRKAGLHVPRGEAAACGFFRPTGRVFSAWRDTLAVARALGAGVVVFQCPASFTPEEENIENMREFFRKVSRDGPVFVWEPRGMWPDPTVSALCRDLGLVHCVDPTSGRRPVTGGTAYFRLHGGPGGYRHGYTDRELGEVLGLCGRFGRAYVLFNNMGMLDDARRFRALARGS